MTQTNINIHTDNTLKRQPDYLRDELGLTMTTVFNISSKTIVRQKRIPFEVFLDIPNVETLLAIDDVNRERNLSKTFHNVTDLMEDLNT